MSLLSCQNLSIAFGGAPLLQDATFVIQRGERIGLLGRNGEGKSTLLKILNAELEPDDGQVTLASGVRIARVQQDVPTGTDASVHDVLSADSTHADAHGLTRAASQFELDLDAPFQSLSGGQKRKVLLARAFASEPDILLLDEPTNHLDLEGIQQLENMVKQRRGGALVFVTHDRAFLQSLATRILEIDRGRLSSWACDYHTFLTRKAERLAAEESEWAQFDKKLAKEEVWVRQGIKARRTRNEGRVRALEALRRQRSERRQKVGSARIDIQSAERSGQKVITAKQVSFSYGETSIIHDFSTQIMRGDRIGLIGSNGCGKTTLLHGLLGRLAPSSGTVEHGTRLEIAYFDQLRAQLQTNRSVAENICESGDYVTINGRERHAYSYLEDFLFSPDRARQNVSVLSGGERNRLLLAKLFAEPSNLLVMDEPSNDLDAETLELLETRLFDYPGTVLVASHDRVFLDTIASSTIVFEDDTIREYVGGYSDWQEQRKRRVRDRNAAAATTTRKPRRSASRSVTNREREEWKALPGQIEILETELDSLGTAMAAPDFFRGDDAEIKRAVARSAELPDLIESAYARWTALDADCS